MTFFLCLICTMAAWQGVAQPSKAISPDLFGLFFEDINYAADGGLYAELIQNRSFEYSPSDTRGFHPFFSWQYFNSGYGYGTAQLDTRQPVHVNNPHYVVLNVEHAGSGGAGLRNAGFDGIPVQAGAHYKFSFFARRLTAGDIPLKIRIETPSGTLAESEITVTSDAWKKYEGRLTVTQQYDSASFSVLATVKGTLALDMISLFPERTFNNRENGLRLDLANALKEIKPKFIRFPGGCLVHGDGTGNMYRWKNTIGPLEERVAQRNIWGYHQTGGLGYFEYFQFCEDIGAKPLPVLPAAVSCQNSGGTWRIGGTGQQALPLDEMDSYIQEVLDLIAWANGPAVSPWGAKRAAAGHPAPFNLEYIGIGNEDKITPEFQQRFTMIAEAVKKKHPEITLIGTSGPFDNGDDFDKGWSLAKNLQVPLVDEHYYKNPKWFLLNHYRYDSYQRTGPKVYLGEYASWGNKLRNAIAEAAFLTALERNGDVVTMASYAPLLAKENHTQWKTDMIFFTNTTLYRTPNYYVQQLFSKNSGQRYYEKGVSRNVRDSTLAHSVVRETVSGDVIIKLVNAGDKPGIFHIDLSAFATTESTAAVTVLTGAADDENSFTKPDAVVPTTSTLTIKKRMPYETPPMSLTVIRIKSKRR